MLKNYLKIAWRNLLKKKAYSFINIFGLGLGMTCCFLIFMFVQDELSYDSYHEKGDRIYRLTHGSLPSKDQPENAGANPFWVWNNAPVGPALKSYFPEIDKIVQFSGSSDILLTDGENSYQEEGVFFMDSTAFDVFSWKVVKGDPKNALTAPYSMVMTESTAKRYFGDEDPIGETGNLSNIYVFSVIGIFILVIAMINFMNLSTARSMERAKEVGIRKSVGAARKHLIFQFLGESIIIVFLAMLTSIIFVSASMPLMNNITGKELELTRFIS